MFQHHEALLCDTEKQFYHAFTRLPGNCQCLYIRLLGRTGIYIRASRLSYHEIEDIHGSLNHLADSGFISDAPMQQLEQWVSLFTRTELQNAIGISGIEPEAASALLSAADLFGQRPIDNLLASERILEVHHHQLFTTFQLLFFGNLHQDLGTFVLRDLGVREFENYPTNTNSLPWQSRDQVDAYLRYHQCRELYEDAQAVGAESLIELQQQLPAPHPHDNNLNRRLAKLTNKIARQLEREDMLDKAAELYQTNTLPPARERLARIRYTTGCGPEAFTICQQIAQHPANTEENDFAQEFSARIARKLGYDYQAPVKVQPAEITLRLPKSNLPVERTAALHFAKSGKCYYVENTLITGIFGLAIWDIIFAPIPGAFYHPFQSAPTDIYETDFYQQRKHLFAARFAQIKKGELRKIVLTNFHRKYGIRNPLVQWGALNRLLLVQALGNIPTPDWLDLFSYLIQDIRNHRNGLPDLIYFPDSGGYSLLEVKGPGDRLQKNQLRWMQQFNLFKINHAVVLVEYTENTLAPAHEPADLLIS